MSNQTNPPPQTRLTVLCVERVGERKSSGFRSTIVRWGKPHYNAPQNKNIQWVDMYRPSHHSGYYIAAVFAAPVYLQFSELLSASGHQPVIMTEGQMHMHARVEVSNPYATKLVLLDCRLLFPTVPKAYLPLVEDHPLECGSTCYQLSIVP